MLFLSSLLGLSCIAILLVYRSRGAVFGPSQAACNSIDALHTHLDTGGKPWDYVGRSPLLVCAAEAESYDVVAELLDLGVEVDTPKKPEFGFPKAPIGSQTTALHEAARNGHAEIATLLLKYGADPTQDSGYWQYTPIPGYLTKLKKREPQNRRK